MVPCTYLNNDNYKISFYVLFPSLANGGEILGLKCLSFCSICRFSMMSFCFAEENLFVKYALSSVIVLGAWKKRNFQMLGWIYTFEIMIFCFQCFFSKFDSGLTIIEVSKDIKKFDRLTTFQSHDLPSIF